MTRTDDLPAELEELSEKEQAQWRLDLLLLGNALIERRSDGSVRRVLPPAEWPSGTERG